MIYLQREKQRLYSWEPFQRCGKITSISGAYADASGLRMCIHELCLITTPYHNILAKAVQFSRDSTKLLLFGSPEYIQPDAEVIPIKRLLNLHISSHMIGRCLDAFGHPIDHLGPLPATNPTPPISKTSPFSRQPIRTMLHTGIKILDFLTPIGQGQRTAIFSAPGLGKSSLLTSLIKNTTKTLKVIALIGERSREVHDLMQHIRNENIPAILVVATAATSAPEKVLAANTAMTIAEYFCSQGKDVMLCMDSLSRYIDALKQLDVSTSSTQEYSPHVLHEIAKLIERAGQFEHGSITAIFSALDYTQHPQWITEYLKSILDGHIFLTDTTQAISTPCIHPLLSLSRVMQMICSPQHLRIAHHIKTLLREYYDAIDIIQLGGYHKGTNPTLDIAIQQLPSIRELLSQEIFSSHAITPILEQLDSLCKEV